MQDDKLVRITLWMSVPFNFGAALMVVFPAVPLWVFLGLPQAPLLHVALLSFVIAGFGVVYGWLALQPQIVRPLLACGVFGKGGVFVLIAGLWLAGAARVGVFAVALVDLAFALVWGRWLLASRSPAAA